MLTRKLGGNQYWIVSRQMLFFIFLGVRLHILCGLQCFISRRFRI